jgi:hypothetical protein
LRAQTLMVLGAVGNSLAENRRKNSCLGVFRFTG